MNKFDLSLAKYIQEYAPIAVDDVAIHFTKNKSSIIRSINRINDKISKKYFISLNKSHINTRLSYAGYSELLNNISLTEYHTNVNERLLCLMVEYGLNDIINKHDFYGYFNVGDTTIKNDRSAFVELLAKCQLTINKIPRIGSQLLGNEIVFRIFIVSTILKTIELEQNNLLVEHHCNSPIERIIAQRFLSICLPTNRQASEIYKKVTQQYKMSLSYNSKKYFLVYLSISLHRMSLGHTVTAATELTPYEYTIFQQQQSENHIASAILSSLTITHGHYNCYDPALFNCVKKFCHDVQSSLVTNIYNDDDFFAEFYRVIYSSLIQSQFSFSLEDKKLERVKIQHTHIYQIIAENIQAIERLFNVTLSEHHLATLTLILKKFTTQNRVSCRQRTRIYLVSNSSENKLGYFIEKLKTQFHVDILGIVNSNEVHQINPDNYDFLLTFTNKISSYLAFYQRDYIKISFDLSPEDLERLRLAGFSLAARKIPLNAFIDDIHGMTDSQIRYLLKSQYSDYFI